MDSLFPAVSDILSLESEARTCRRNTKKRLFKTQGQLDEALDKVKEQRLELCKLKTELEEEKDRKPSGQPGHAGHSRKKQGRGSMLNFPAGQRMMSITEGE